MNRYFYQIIVLCTCFISAESFIFGQCRPVRCRCGPGFKKRRVQHGRRWIIVICEVGRRQWGGRRGFRRHRRRPGTQREANHRYQKVDEERCKLSIKSEILVLKLFFDRQ